MNAVALLLMCYFADNWRFSILTGPSVGQRIEQAKEVLGLAEDRILEDYVFINTSYDRELVPVFDEYGFSEGKIDITDRGKLAEFLSQLDNRHKYVMMDVFLSNRFQSESDSLLIAEILKTDRIGIARSATASLPDKRLIPKSGYSDYATNIYETNFVKYEFINDGNETLPYKAFLSENPEGKIVSLGPFHFHNGRLSWKSLTLRFPIKLWDETKPNGEDTEGDIMQEKVLLNLGTDILDMEMDIPSLVEDKIVVIGDFREDDIHDTYLGKMAGPVINVNALEALRNNDLEIPWWLMVFLLVLYSGITYFVLHPNNHNNLINKLLNHKRLQSKFFRYLFSFVGFTVFFAIISGIIYLTAGIDVNILLPSLWFTFISNVIKYKRNSF